MILLVSIIHNINNSAEKLNKDCKKCKMKNGIQLDPNK